MDAVEGLDTTKFSVEEVNKQDLITFLNDKLYKEETISSPLVYGLYCNGELLQVMALGKSHLSGNYQWELISYITSDTHIDNGFHELWNHFLNNNSVHSCITCFQIESIRQYLEECGFKNTNSNLNQIYSYFPFGVVFKCVDETTGKFYIGKCEIENKWLNGYVGSGSKWRSYYNKYKDTHNFTRIILKDDFESPREMLDYEAKAIQKYCSLDKNGKHHISDANCMNIIVESQAVIRPCNECGGYLSHKKTCSQYKPPKEPEPCEFCGKIRGGHKKSCPKYSHKRPEPCSECGSINGHKDNCSKSKGKCPECGYSVKSNRHAKTCSFYKEVTRKAKDCSECGGKGGHHRNGCSKQVICDICGGKDGNHKLDCSRKRHTICSECGSSTHHKPWCSKYKEPKKCPECGGSFGHKKSCSKYKEKICEECGGKGGHHKGTCSKYSYKEEIKCEECGAGNHNHKKTCSKYTPPKKCAECGSPYRHKSWCSKSKTI